MADHDTHDHTGIPGVGGSGIPASIVDAKGDLIAATAADTVARLAVISGNGSSLVVASGESTGLKWQKNNYAASTAPAVGDDDGDGYSIGSIWIDTTGDAGYICVDASTGAAVWLPFDSSSGESWEGTWSAGTYDTGMIVVHDDIVYQANTTTSDEPPSADWDELFDGSGGGPSYGAYIDAILATTGLLAYWPMQDSATPTSARMGIADYSRGPRGAYGGAGGFAPTLAQTGPTFDEGAQLAVSFDGGDFFDVSRYFGSREAYSVEAWVKTSSTGSIPIICERGTAPGLTFQVGTRPGGGGAAGRVAFYADYSSLDLGIHTTSATVNDGNWHHVVATWASGGTGVALASSQFKIYIDGSAAAISSGAGNIGSVNSPITGGGGPWLAHNQPANTFWTGSLAHVAVYNVELSSGDVTAHYNAAI